MSQYDHSWVNCINHSPSYPIPLFHQPPKPFSSITLPNSLTDSVSSNPVFPPTPSALAGFATHLKSLYRSACTVDTHSVKPASSRPSANIIPGDPPLRTYSQSTFSCCAARRTRESFLRDVIWWVRIRQLKSEGVRDMMVQGGVERR
jgi:hypothetical protein